MSVQDSYVDSYVDRRAGRTPVASVYGVMSITKALAAKSNAVRRLERQGRRARYESRINRGSAMAA